VNGYVHARVCGCGCTGAGVCLPRVALLIHQATRSCILSFAAPQVPFSTLSHKWHYFRGKVTEYKMFILIFSTNCM
jgi:hypothetical protein